MQQISGQIWEFCLNFILSFTELASTPGPDSFNRFCPPILSLVWKLCSDSQPSVSCLRVEDHAETLALKYALVEIHELFAARY